MLSLRICSLSSPQLTCVSAHSQAWTRWGDLLQSSSCCGEGVGRGWRRGGEWRSEAIGLTVSPNSLLLAKLYSLCSPASKMDSNVSLIINCLLASYQFTINLPLYLSKNDEGDICIDFYILQRAFIHFFLWPRRWVKLVNLLSKMHALKLVNSDGQRWHPVSASLLHSNAKGQVTLSVPGEKGQIGLESESTMNEHCLHHLPGAKL